MIPADCRFSSRFCDIVSEGWYELKKDGEKSATERVAFVTIHAIPRDSKQRMFNLTDKGSYENTVRCSPRAAEQTIHTVDEHHAIHGKECNLNPRIGGPRRCHDAEQSVTVLGT